MQPRWVIYVAMAALDILTICVMLAGADEPKKPEDSPKVPAESIPPRKPQEVIGRALEFLEKDVVKWRKEKVCATCHHGTMTVWALSEAKSQGYAVDAESLADIVQWTKGRFLKHLDQPRDSRPGWSMVNTPAIYLGVMTKTLPILSHNELTRLANHLERHQEADGAISWSSAPPANRYPPFFESDEVATLLALLAWEPHQPADPTQVAAARASRDKAAEWLNKTKPTDTTQSIALRLLLEVRNDTPAEQRQSGINQLLNRQSADGGWAQDKDAPSDAYATGQALYALSCAGVKENRAEVQRAAAFLVATQQENGSWPMIPRAQPGGKPAANLMPITYFGSAWATLGLVRFVPMSLDPAKWQKLAFDEIRILHGKYDVDETSPDRPVVRVDLRDYEVGDSAVADLAKVLQAFPSLVTLEFKSTNITDEGLTHLKSLPQLRRLALENAAITDAGLAHLKVLTYLEELNLKGTKITDAGVQDIQQALPKTKVER